MTVMTEESAPAAQASDGKIICELDGARVHSVQLHLKNNHPGITLDDYQKKFPGAPILSEFAKKRLKEAQDSKVKAAANAVIHGKKGFDQQALHEVFDLGAAKAAMNARGQPIMIDVMVDWDEEGESLIPDVDPNYIFSIELVKSVLIGWKLGMTAYFWGYHGSGKTTIFEQCAARTKRPFLRVQHTINTEEAHVLGQWTVKNGETVYQLGPLPMAMINGWIYCADEYDFAPPSVTSLYQPVLEGKALVIKDAPPELRVIRPHPNFRIVATGNTNGSGDETGLYQGTQIQNAANYSRFNIVEEVQYLEPKVETTVVAGQAGIERKDAENLINFGTEVRKMFAGGKIGATISTRELITSAKLGMVLGSDWKMGLRKGFINRMSRVDQEVCLQYAQRLFG